MERLLRVDGVSGVGVSITGSWERVRLTRPRKERYGSALVIELLMEKGSLVPNSVGLRTRRLLLGVGYRRSLASPLEYQLAR